MSAKYFNIAVLFFFCSSLFSQETLKNRKPWASGRFYANNPDELKNHLQQLFAKAVGKRPDKTPLAIVVPHAGYVFSGEVAAAAYNQIDPNRTFERIFIIGSSHTTSFKGASVYCSGNFETPLGTVKVDLELARKLVKENDIFRDYPEAHLYEHSLEVQLPFLQYHLKNDFKIVPIIIGSSTAKTSRELAGILKPWLNGKNLFVISSDFSHYPNYNDACKADLITAEAIKSNKASNLIDALDHNDSKGIPELVTSLCGWSSVLTLLYMTEPLHDLRIDLIRYMNSGDSSYGDRQRVVGYWAISFTQGNEKNQILDFSLGEEDKKTLLNLARQTITSYIINGKIPEVNAEKFSPSLKTQSGVFVTLTRDHHLRGCIGHFEADYPLWQIIQKMAVAAATRDYRFEKVNSDEIKKLRIEISVLTPLRRIKSADEFILGKQGIYIKKGNSSGTFLPEVAKQTGWTKDEFLGHCAQDKAGLGWDEWKSAELYTYEALVFSEEEQLVPQ